MQQQLETISDFLKMSGFQYRVFDLGRKIQRISNQRFARSSHSNVNILTRFNKKHGCRCCFGTRKAKPSR